MANFITFGCWNNIDGKYNEVIDKIKSYIKINSIDFLSITGDNYYNKKEKKKKTFIEDDFINGFKKLNEIEDVVKYYILGNHDIKDYESCEPLTLLKHPVKHTNDILYSQYTFDRNTYYKIHDTVINIFLDSTIYEISDIKFVKDTCYKIIFPDFRGTIKELKDYQLDMTIKALRINPRIKQVIFHFHHPIFSIKNKTATTKLDISSGLTEFYQKLKEHLNKKQIYHICADTHFYEEGIVNLNDLTINQYIVGTGGTILDNIHKKDSCNSVIKIDNLKYTITNSIQNHGFLHVLWDNEELHFNFIQIDSPESIRSREDFGGSVEDPTKQKNRFYLIKYLKYKKKYLILKKNNIINL